MLKKGGSYLTLLARFANPSRSPAVEEKPNCDAQSIRVSIGFRADRFNKGGPRTFRDPTRIFVGRVCCGQEIFIAMPSGLADEVGVWTPSIHGKSVPNWIQKRHSFGLPFPSKFRDVAPSLNVHYVSARGREEDQSSKDWAAVIVTSCTLDVDTQTRTGQAALCCFDILQYTCNIIVPVLDPFCAGSVTQGLGTARVR